MQHGDDDPEMGKSRQDGSHLQIRTLTLEDIGVNRPHKCCDCFLRTTNAISEASFKTATGMQRSQIILETW